MSLSPVALLAALSRLEVANDNQWTQEGLPRLDALKFLTGGVAVTREEIAVVAPEFSRASPVLPGAAKAAETPQAPATAPAGTSAPREPENALQGAGQGESDGTDQGADSADLGEAHQEAQARPAQAERTDAENLARLGVYIEELTKDAADIASALAKAQRAYDELAEKLAGPGSRQTLAEALNGYQKRQQQLRMERAARMAALKGVPLADILPMQPAIDAAMRRKTARGGQRPVYPKA